MPASHPIIALWAVPRSVSTAFERMMSARGDFEVFNEPFSQAYYHGPTRASERFPDEPPSDDHDPERVLHKLMNAAKRRPVFFKDMALHVRRFMTPGFLASFRNAVLIRDPRLALVSLHKKMPDFSREETGYESLAELVEILESLDGSPPFTMDGEVLRAEPARVSREFCDAMGIPFEPDALEWKPGGEAHWDHWQEWFDEAAQSQNFKPPAAMPEAAALAIPEIRDALEYCVPCYEKLMNQ